MEPTSGTCKAYTKKGKRCTNKVKQGQDYCWQHLPESPQHQSLIKKITIGAVVTAILAAIGLWADLTGIGFLAPIVRKTTPTVQSLCPQGKTACPIIIIATFDGNDSIQYQNRLLESIQGKIEQTGNSVIVSKLERSIASSEDAIQIIKEYGAEVVIWGWQDDEGVRIYLLDSNYQAAEITKSYQWGYDYIYYPDQIHEIKIGIVPEETAFISLYSIGVACYYGEDYSCAQSALSAAIASSENIESLSTNINTFADLLPSAYLYNGLTKLKQGVLVDAIEALNKSAELDMSLGAYGYLGLGYYDLGDLSNALSDADEAIRMAPQNFSAHYIRAWLYSRPSADMDNQAIAFQEYTKLTSWEDIDCRFKAMAYNGRGNLYLSKMEFDKALEDYSEALSCANDSSRAIILVNSGIAQNGLKRFQDAL